MSPWFDTFERMLRARGGLLEVAASLTIGTCVATVFAAVLVNFLSCRQAKGIKRERKSIVATGTMTAFFLVFYIVIRLRIGELAIPASWARISMVVAGLIVIVFGCVVNVLGRLQLGQNWANQATIYREQKLVTSGVYGWVRHPLYASLIWMFFGASLVYANVTAFLLNGLVFVPFMAYRARLEEALLTAEFTDYSDYRRRVGLFFWKPGLLPKEAYRKGKT